MHLRKNTLLTIINGIAALFIIVLLLLLARSVISLSMSKVTPEKKSAVQQRTPMKKDLMDYGSILKKNPFGFNGGELSSLVAKSGSATVSSDVILVGTVSGSRRFSYAIFSDKSNNQEVFGIGDSVFGLGSLERVEKDRVLINDKGMMKEIQIADIVLIKEAGVPGSKSVVPGDSFARKTAETSYVLDGQKVQQALANPNQIMTDARLLPNASGGKQEGFILREVRNGGIYQSLGLRDGDILLRINDYNISNPEAALQAFTALKGMDRVQLDIVRNNTRMSMTYQIR